MSLDRLNADCLGWLLEKLAVRELTQLAQTNRFFHRIITQRVGFPKLVWYFRIYSSRQKRFNYLCSTGQLKWAQSAYSVDLSVERAFWKSCGFGQITVAKWLWHQREEELAVDLSSCFRFASQQGHRHIVEWLLQVVGARDFNENLQTAFVYSCEQGHLELAQWLWLIGEATIDVTAHFCYSFTSACENGHLAMSQWLWDWGDFRIYIPDGSGVFAAACGQNHRDVAEWLLELSGQIDQPLDELAYHGALINSCARGHHDMARWLYQLVQDRGFPPDFVTLSEAWQASCQGNHLDLARWVWAHLQFVEADHSFYRGPAGLMNNTFSYVCLQGYLEVAQYIWELLPEFRGEVEPDIFWQPQSNAQMRIWLASINLSYCPFLERSTSYRWTPQARRGGFFLWLFDLPHRLVPA